MKNSIQKKLNLNKLQNRNPRTQGELANEVGISRTCINQIINNHSVPSLLHAFKIANALKKDIDKIFYLEDGE